ncbi:MAG: hypothetical protein ACREIV_02260, partial [Planctomycetaceae bacterium]
NNLFAANTATPLVVMSGALDADEFRRLLKWNGEKNFYDQFAVFWSITPTEAGALPERLDFDAWKQMWAALGDTSEVGAANDPVPWRQNWLDRELRDLQPADFALRQDPQTAPFEATDGTHAGADPQRLQPPAE